MTMKTKSRLESLIPHVRDMMTFKQGQLDRLHPDQKFHTRNATAHGMDEVTIDVVNDLKADIRGLQHVLDELRKSITELGS